MQHRQDINKLLAYLIDGNMRQPRHYHDPGVRDARTRLQFKHNHMSQSYAI